jgi:hypothetical protein
MKAGRVLGVVLAGGSLVLLAWVVVVLAQQPRLPGSTKVPAPSNPYNPSSVGGLDSFGPSTTVPPPTRFAAGSSGNAYQSFPPPSHPGADLSLLPVKVELRKGLALDGQIAVTGPLVCGTAFGEAAIPLTAIRGIRLHEGEAAAGQERPLPQATIILTNNDSLTVSLTAAQIQVKTEWGEANIQIAHFKSLLLTSDNVQWQEVNGRWALVSVEKPAVEKAPPALDNALETLPSVPLQDGADATGPNSPPRLSVPPLEPTPTEPSLPRVPSPTEPPGPN